MSEKIHIHLKDRRPLEDLRPGDSAAHYHNDEKHNIEERAKDTPGIICIERKIHDDAVVISGTLTVEYDSVDLNALVADELEKAAQAVKSLEGIVGHIKAAVSVTSTDVISVTDDKAMVTVSPHKRARVALAAIVFMVEPKEAETLIRKALAGVRGSLRNELSPRQDRGASPKEMQSDSSPRRGAESNRKVINKGDLQ